MYVKLERIVKIYFRATLFKVTMECNISKIICFDEVICFACTCCTYNCVAFVDIFVR